MRICKKCGKWFESPFKRGTVCVNCRTSPGSIAKYYKHIDMILKGEKEKWSK